MSGHPPLNAAWDGPEPAEGPLSIRSRNQQSAITNQQSPISNHQSNQQSPINKSTISNLQSAIDNLNLPSAIDNLQ
jgi:hypothetical protein